MFITAAWALEQEYKLYKWMQLEVPPVEDMSPEQQLFASSFATLWGAGHVALASMPYNQLMNVRGRLIEWTIVEKLNARHPSGFSIKGGKITPKWVRPSMAARMGAKIGARAIPYVGWALLATDLYLTGKWLKEKL